MEVTIFYLYLMDTKWSDAITYDNKHKPLEELGAILTKANTPQTDWVNVVRGFARPAPPSSANKILLRSGELMAEAWDMVMGSRLYEQHEQRSVMPGTWKD